MVLWVQYQLSVSVINSSVCKEIKRETTSKHFSLESLKVTWEDESEDPDDAPDASQHRDRLQARHQVHVCSKYVIPIFIQTNWAASTVFTPKKLGPQMVVVLLASPTGDNPWWKMGTNRRPGANSGTNGRLVSEANCSCTSCEGTHGPPPCSNINTWPKLLLTFW